MHCPFCAADDTRVVDSRPAEGGSVVRRRRECNACEQRFTTYERPAVLMMVKKRSGVLEPFDPAKVRRGVESALADRPVPPGVVDRLIADVCDAVQAGGAGMTTEDVGREVLARLRQIDEVAYLRFASVYKEFTGAEDFERAVAELERSSDR